MAQLIDTNNQAWQPIRPELTTGIAGKLLLEGPMKMVLTRVEPGGFFRPHRDNYSHLFHILSGQALARVEAKEYLLLAGFSLQVEAGERHEYENNGQQELLLLSINLPQA